MRRDLFLGVLFSILAALCYGGGSVLVKWGLREWSSPMMALSISLFFGSLALFLFEFRSVRAYPTTSGKAMGALVVSGLASGLAGVFNYLALGIAPVVIVVPLTSTAPLVTILLLMVFFRGLEQMTPRVGIAALFVILGGILITLSA
ncbi:MAG: EamA family transporter [Chloroflexi bacterium]|nr:EamA family transporter [Chloroflexota bacterium]